MNKLLSLHDRIIGQITALLGEWFLPLLARFTFAAVLFMYFWRSGLTKLGDGIGGLFSLNPNAYIQIFPGAMEAVGYDHTALSFFHKIIAIFGTWAEFILPIMIVIGLFTRLAALGMMGFVIVQTFVDVTGHGAAFGSWFNNQSGEVIADQRLLWFVLLFILVVKGAGKFSADHMMKRSI